MKDKISADIKEVFESGKNWALYEIEYAKLTAAEKITILGTAIALIAVIMLMMLPVMVMLSFVIAEAFRLFLTPALAYLCVAGIWIIVVLIIFLFRKQLISDPIAKFITRLLLKK